MVVDGKLSLITFIPPKNFILIRILFLKKTTNISESDFHVEWTTAMFVFVSSDGYFYFLRWSRCIFKYGWALCHMWKKCSGWKVKMCL